MIRRYIALAVLGASLAGPAAARPLSSAKLGLHVRTAAVKNACAAVSGLGCSDHGSLLNTTAPIASGVDIYLVTLDIPTDVGLAGVSCGLSYGAVSIGAWHSCADLETATGDWPSSGSGISVSFSSCRGTTPDTNDPEGDGIAVLGYFAYVYAYSAQALTLTGLSGSGQPVEYMDCAGGTFQGPQPGAVGFGVAGTDPCYSTPIDCGCGFSQVGGTGRTCCCSDAGNNEITCDYYWGETLCLGAGGTVVHTSCGTPCDVACAATTAEPSRWGQIKRRYN